MVVVASYVTDTDDGQRFFGMVVVASYGTRTDKDFSGWWSWRVMGHGRTKIFRDGVASYGTDMVDGRTEIFWDAGRGELCD